MSYLDYVDFLPAIIPHLKLFDVTFDIFSDSNSTHLEQNAESKPHQCRDATVNYVVIQLCFICVKLIEYQEYPPSTCFYFCFEN